MSIFEKMAKKKVCTSSPQTSNSHTFDLLGSYSPACVCNPELYRMLREVIPVIDTAIHKIVRLTGGFTVKSNNGRNQTQLEDFIRNINVNKLLKSLARATNIYVANKIFKLCLISAIVGFHCKTTCKADNLMNCSVNNGNDFS